jgi:hypothetical protein
MIPREMYTVQMLEDMLVLQCLKLINLVTHYVYMTDLHKLHRLIVLLVTNQQSSL